MRAPSTAEFQHFKHALHAPGLEKNERRTRWVVLLTATMMVVEIFVGYLSNSLALLADGWHMATHAGALGISAFAYWFARTRSEHASFTFGTGKVYALAGYTNAVCLLLVAAFMLFESGSRLLSPEPVDFREALPIAVLGLVVNLVSALVLDAHDHGDGHDHAHGAGHGAAKAPAQACDHDHDHGAHDHAHEGEHAHDHAHDHAQDHAAISAAGPHAKATKAAHQGGGHDHNLRSAYLHVLADALTSVLAIVALVVGRVYGVLFLDSLVAALGSLVIGHWAVKLTMSAAAQLLDVTPSVEEERAIRSRLEALGDEKVLDLHLWELGPAHRGCIVSLVASEPKSLAEYREAVLSAAKIEHLTVEVRAEKAKPAQEPT